MKTRELCVRLCCAVIDFFLLAACHYSSPDLTVEGLGEKIKGFLVYFSRYHYTWNMNLEVLDDSIQLEHLPVKDTHVSLNKGDRAVTAEFPIHSQDSADNVWMKPTRSQGVQEQVRSRDLVRSSAPIDSISQLIHLSSNTCASYFVIILALSVGTYLLRALMKKQLQMVYSNDIDSVYSPFPCLLMAFSAAVYETMRVFVPDTWEYFYLNPTLSPFKVPFILSAFLLSIWLLTIVTLVVFGDLSRQLAPAAAALYLLGLVSYRALYYFFFILAAHIYIGYLFLVCFIQLPMKKVRRNSGYEYRYGNCGQKFRGKGVYPHCGAINE